MNCSRDILVDRNIRPVHYGVFVCVCVYMSTCVCVHEYVCVCVYLVMSAQGSQCKFC